MLKRSDLAKQFEMVVQQEIKNFQAGRDLIMDRLNTLQFMIDDLNEKIRAYQNMMLQQHKNVEIEIEKLKKDHSEHQQKLSSHIKDTEKFKEKCTGELGMQVDYGLQNYRRNEANANRIDELFRRLESFEDEICGHSGTVSHSLDQMRHGISKELARVKHEILSMPSDSEAIKKEFDDKINAHKVDGEGILKDIRATNHSVFVIQKQIENIYTLIERLKKSEVSK